MVCGIFNNLRTSSEKKVRFYVNSSITERLLTLDTVHLTNESVVDVTIEHKPLNESDREETTVNSSYLNRASEENM